MPKLIKNITVDTSDINNYNINAINNIKFVVAETDCNFIEVDGFVGFVLNFKQVVNSESIETNTTYGLISNSDKNFEEILIDEF